MTATRLALAATLAIAASAPTRATAQTPTPPPGPEPVPSSALLLRVRAPRATLDTAREVAVEIGTRKLSVRGQFLGLLRKRYQKELAAFAQQRADLRRDFEREVPKAQRRLLAAAKGDEIATLRDSALSVTRREGLTKAMIKAEIDPALERLRALLLPSLDDVLDGDEKLSDDLDDLAEVHDELLGWFDLYVDTRRGIGDTEGGQAFLGRKDELPPPPALDDIEPGLERRCLYALPLAARDRKNLERNEELRAGMVHEEFVGTLELNRIRIALGLPTLRIDPKLGDAARGHSEDMQRLKFFSHTSPIPEKKTPGMRAALAGTTGGAENIAAGQDSGRGAIRAWWYSPGHHKNMLGGHGRTGLGQAGHHWTQMFGG